MFLRSKFLKKLEKSMLFGSITIKFKSEFSAFFKANLIPFFSISSFEFLIPAVSDIITG